MDNFHLLDTLHMKIMQTSCKVHQTFSVFHGQRRISITVSFNDVPEWIEASITSLTIALLINSTICMVEDQVHKDSKYNQMMIAWRFKLGRLWTKRYHKATPHGHVFARRVLSDYKLILRL